MVIVAAVVIGDGRVHNAQPEPDKSYLVIIVCYVSRVRKSRLARVGNTADSSGSRNTPRWTMSFVLTELGKRLFARERRVDMYFLSLRFAESFNRILKVQHI